MPEKSALVHYDKQSVTPQEICDYIDDMGFDASLTALESDQEAIINECRIHINGMTCNSCVKSIEGMISTKAGVESIVVSLEEKEGCVKYAANKVNPEEIAEQIEDMGFDAYVKTINGKLTKNGII